MKTKMLQKTIAQKNLFASLLHKNVNLHVSKIPMLLQMSNSVLVLLAIICLRSEHALYSLDSFLIKKKKTLAVL